MSLKEIERHAANAKRMYDVHRARGMTSAQAAGWAANAQAESDGDYRRIQKGGPGRGLFQWGANNAKMDRRPHFHVLFKHPIEKSTEEEQLAFRDWELANTEVGAARRIAKAKSAGDIAAAITIHYERPKEKARDAADRANIAEAILRLEKEAILRRERDDILRRAKKER